MIPVWWLASALAQTSSIAPGPVALCTDRGPLVGTVAADGSVEATLAATQTVGGSLASLRIESGGDVVFEGPLDALHPRPSALHPTRSDVGEALAEQLGLTVVDGQDTLALQGDGFEGRVGSDGVLRGRRGAASEVWVLDVDGRAFGGPAELTAPLIDVARRHGIGRPAVTVRVAADHLREVGLLLDCGRGGREHVGLGVWPTVVPLPEGVRVTDGRVDEVLLRDADGAPTWLLALPADRELAGMLQAELSDRWPDLKPTVLWSDGAALVSLSRSAGWSPPGDAVAPVTGGPSLVPLLDPHPAVVLGTELPGEAGYGVLESGREVVALLNHHRAAMGLPTLTWSAPLALAAALHGAWLQQDTAPDGHRQEPGEPLFVGERPVDRGGASEVVHRRVGASSWESVDAWLQAPLHRVWPLHPGATEAGAVALPRARVAEVRVEERDVVPSVVFPPEGSVAPGLLFAGRESPDPLPLHRFPERVWPVGLPVSLWVTRGTRLRKVRLSAEGQELDAWVVEPGPSAPRDAVHLIPRDPLPPGAEITWRMSVEGPEGPRVHTGSFRTPEEPLSEVIGVEGAAARALATANARREQLGRPAITTTRRAETLARWVGARTRAVQEGLPPQRARQSLAPIRSERLAGAQRICLRPGDAFEVDESWLDPSVRDLGVEEGATTLTWSTDPTTGQTRMSLAGPRTCVLLLAE